MLDRSIEASLVTGCPQISIELGAAMPLDALAPRLDRWLVAVANNGGDVRIRPAAERPRVRGLGLSAFGSVASETWKYFQALREKRKQRLLASAAAQYDATIYVDDAGAAISSVVLTRRQER